MSVQVKAMVDHGDTRSYNKIAQELLVKQGRTIMSFEGTDMYRYELWPQAGMVTFIPPSMIAAMNQYVEGATALCKAMCILTITFCIV